MKFHYAISVVFLLMAMQANGQGAIKQTADVYGQGIDGPVVSEEGASLIRTKNGITVAVSMPTPVPTMYSYPGPNPFQPEVFMGSPEVFTGWLFFFNSPGSCAEPNACVPPGDFADGQGGVYNFAGHIAAGGGSLNMVGHISVGDATFGGPFTLQNTWGAEIHVAIAPHGTVQPALMPGQINTPIGSPPFWWLSLFFDPDLQ